MKTAEAGFRFPVLGFTPDQEMWGFQDLDTLTSCGPRTLKHNLQVGMELIDADGRRWRVRSVKRIGRAEPVGLWLLSMLLSTPQSRIEHDLERLEPVALAEVQERACVSVNMFSEGYCADDEREEILEPLLVRIRSSHDIAGVHEGLGLDSFQDY
jgi:hypothetical protein